MGDKKKAAMAILGPREDEVPENPPDELGAVAQELIDSVKSGDAGAVASCLRAAFEMLGQVGE